MYKKMITGNLGANELNKNDNGRRNKRSSL